MFVTSVPSLGQLRSMAIGPSKAGSFTGDGDANKIIPHGLGFVPLRIRLRNNSVGVLWTQIEATSQRRDDGITTETVTSWDDTNFYVNGTTNTDGSSYVWVASG